VAEPIRLALVAGGVEFEDHRLEQGAWPELKPHTPFGSLPTLTLDDGEVLAQSEGLLRYAGKKAGLYPRDDDLAALRVDMWLGAVGDIEAAIRPSMFEKDADRKAAMRKTLAEETLPRWLGILNKRLEATGDGHLAGGALTIADLKLFVVLDNLKSGILDGVPATVADPYPKLQELYAAVAAHERIAAYRSKMYPPK